MIFLLLFITPIIGVFGFLNLVTLLQKMKDGKNYHNQKVLGGFITFLFIFCICFLILALE